MEDLTAHAAFIKLLGSEAILFLFIGYALLEWGAFLIRKMLAGSMKLERAKLFFGLATLSFSLFPLLLEGFALRTQLFGLVLEQIKGAVLAMALLLVGMICQTLAFWAFGHIARKKVSQKEMAGSGKT